jgi:hypothetical protein
MLRPAWAEDDLRGYCSQLEQTRDELLEALKNVLACRKNAIAIAKIVVGKAERSG